MDLAGGLGRGEWGLDEFESGVVGRRVGKVRLAWGLAGAEGELAGLVTQGVRRDFDQCSARFGEEDVMAAAFADAGWRVVDGIVTFRVLTEGFRGVGFLREGGAGDSEAVGEIAAEAFREGRYFRDPGFTAAEGRAVYRAWGENACLGRYGDGVLVGEEDGEVTGFVSLHERGEAVSVGLIAVGSSWRGRGWGRRLFAGGLGWAGGRGFGVVLVGTQVTNVAAVGLYERFGGVVSGRSVTLAV